MALTFKTFGGEDLDPEVDLTDNVVWEEVEFTTRSYKGEADLSSIPFRDEDGDISASGATTNIYTRNIMELALDGQRLWRGRRARMTSERFIQKADRARLHRVNGEDINVDLRGIPIKTWPRPAETDVERVQALGAAFLNGSPRATTVLDVTTYVPTTVEVSLPAYTYTRTDPFRVLQEVAAQAGKNFFVTIDDELYYDRFESSAYATTLSISDRPDDVGAGGGYGSDPLCYAPQWLSGPPIEFDGTTWMSGAVNYYGAGANDYVEENSEEKANEGAYWVEILQDDQAADAASAARHLHQILQRGYQGLGYNVAIGPMTDAHVKLLKPGQLIAIKARVIGAANAFINRRITQLTWKRPRNGVWYAYMVLEAPHRALQTGRGPIFQAPCEDFTSVGSLGSNATHDPNNYEVVSGLTGPRCERVALTLSGSVPEGHSIVVIAGFENDAGQFDTGVGDDKGNAWIRAGMHLRNATGFDEQVEIWYANVTSALSAGDKIYYEADLGSSLIPTQETGARAISAWEFNGTIASAVESGTGGAFSTTPAVTVGSGDLIVAALSVGSEGDTITDDVDWTAFDDADPGAGGGSETTLHGGWRLADTNGETWSGTIDQNRDWATVGAVFTVAGDCQEPEPVGGTDDADPGSSSGPAAPLDHVHPHGYITTGGPYHVAEDITVADAGGNFTGTDVEAVLAELADDIDAISPGGGIGWFNVKDYGAAGDGSTDDTSDINDAIAALNSAGAGVLYFPHGRYIVSSALTAITAITRVLGDGSQAWDDSADGSTIECTSSTAALFTISSKRVRFEHLTLLNDTAASAGAAIVTTSAYSSQRTNYHDLFVRGFYDGVDSQTGTAWVMDSCVFHGQVRYSLRVRNIVNDDVGDWDITNCYFTATSGTTDAAIRIESSGGGKITGTKINAFGGSSYTNGISMAAGTGVDTVILHMANSSIENVSGDAVALTTTGTGRWRSLTFVGNEFGLWGNDTGYAISLSAAASDNLADIVILGNTFITDGTARSAVEMVNVDNAVLGANPLDGFDDLYDATTSTNIVELGASAVSDLDDLGDVTITAPAEDDDLRYNGSAWVNDSRKWEAVTNAEDVFVWEGDDLVHEWST